MFSQQIIMKESIMNNVKVIVTNKDNGERAIIEDMYLWFLLYEKMKSFGDEMKDYDVVISDGSDGSK
jgi:hypothetical protein